MKCPCGKECRKIELYKVVHYTDKGKMIYTCCSHDIVIKDEKVEDAK